MGIRGKVSRNTLAHANQVRDWRIYADFAQILIPQARQLYAHDPLDVELDQTRLRSGFHHDRSVSVPFPLGQPSASTKARSNSTRFWIFTGSIPTVIHYHPWQGSRRQHPRPDSSRARSLLRHGSGLSGFCPTSSNPSGFGLLRHPSQKQLPVQTALLSAGGQIHWRAMRSDHYPWRVSTATKVIPRSCGESATSIPEQDKRLVFLTNNFTLPALTIAELYRCRWQVELFFKWIKQHLRIKAFYRHLRERRQDPDLDRDLRLCAGGHRQKAAQSGRQPLHNSTDFERHPFRENAHFTGPHGLGTATTRCHRF